MGFFCLCVLLLIVGLCFAAFGFCDAVCVYCFMFFVLWFVCFFGFDLWCRFV